MRCDQEECPFWDGDGCPCSVLDISADDREKAKRAYRNLMGHDWDESSEAEDDDLMGCDIHLFVEKQVATGVWVDITKPEDDPDRSYWLFANLAGVRNNDGITPISEPRGIPEDTAPTVRAYMDDEWNELHSKSWLTLAELLTHDWLTSPWDGGAWWTDGFLNRWHQIVIEDSRLTLDDLRIVFAFDN